jgi:arylsulfatase A-like enzyme
MIKKFLLSLCFASMAFAQQSQPNILLLLSDDLGHRDLNSFNDIQPNPAPAITPNIDSLASQGLRVTRMHSHPLCSTSRVSILSGMNPNIYGLGTNPEANPTLTFEMPLSATILPEVLKTLGYTTAAFGKWHVSTDLNLDMGRLHGFDTVRAGSLMNLSPNETYFDWERIDDGVGTQTTEYNTEAIGDAVIDYMGEQTPDTPWFAYVAFHAPHGAFHNPPTHLTPAYTGPPITGGTAIKNRLKYDLMIQTMDTVIGEIMLSIPANTIVIFMSENGTPNGVPHALQNQFKVKKSAFREGIEVPFIAWDNFSLIDTGDYNGVLQVSDMFSTILEFAGVGPCFAAPPTSISFAKNLINKNHAPGRYRAFSEMFVDNGFGTSFRVRRAVTGRRYKYMERTLMNGQPIFESFYDLINDPTEINNLLNGTLTAHENEAYLQLKEIMDANTL